MLSSKLFVALAAAVASASALVVRSTDTVVRPQITAPTVGEQWPVASTQIITWDTSSIPADAQNYTGLILLGYLEPGNPDEHLDIGGCPMFLARHCR